VSRGEPTSGQYQARIPFGKGERYPRWDGLATPAGCQRPALTREQVGPRIADSRIGRKRQTLVEHKDLNINHLRKLLGQTGT
jgi:hypothetical protein